MAESPVRSPPAALRQFGSELSPSPSFLSLRYPHVPVDGHLFYSKQTMLNERLAADNLALDISPTGRALSGSALELTRSELLQRILAGLGGPPLPRPP
jgi:hypothetical protein